MPTRVEPGIPEFFPRLSVEGPETAVICAADKDQAAGRYDRPTHVRRSRLRRAFRREFIHLAERHAPGDLSSVQIDCAERAPGRLLTGVFVRIPETGVGPPRAGSQIGRASC